MAKANLPAPIRWIASLPGGQSFINFMASATAPVRALPRQIRVGFALATLFALLVYTGVIIAPLSVVFFGPVSIVNILIVGLFGFTLIYFFFADLAGRIKQAKKRRPNLKLRDLVAGKVKAPLWGWFVLFLGFLYFIWPLDIIPDFVGIPGYLDDLAILSSLYGMFIASLKLIRK